MSTLLILLCIVVGSVVVHEGGHLISYRFIGWEVQGFVVRWYGVGWQVETRNNPGAGWISALAGLMATALLTLACVILMPLSEWFQVAALLNAVLLVSNLIPIPISDGGHLWKALR